jgi:hypothetical protein
MMDTTPVAGRLLERLRIFTVLGIRFWDILLDAAVGDGLSAMAWALGDAAAPVPAVRTRAGVYAFHGLPGLRDVEYPRSDAAPVAETHDFAITVEDALGRFLPMLFVVALPLRYRGPFAGMMVGSLPSATARVPLFSAPTRPLPPGFAAVRADVWDTRGEQDAAAVERYGAPAAHAVVHVAVDDVTYMGLADARGRVLVPIALPVAERLGATSLPSGGADGMSGVVPWPLRVSVWYAPDRLRFPLASRVASAWRDLPSVRSIAREQTPALFIDEEGGAPAETLDAQIGYGEELVLGTARRDSAPGERSSLLWVSRGASPP